MEEAEEKSLHRDWAAARIGVRADDEVVDLSVIMIDGGCRTIAAAG